MASWTNEEGRPGAEDTRTGRHALPVERRTMYPYLTKLQKDIGVGTPGFNLSNALYFQRLGAAARRMNAEYARRTAETFADAGITAEALVSGLPAIEAAHPELVTELRARELAAAS